MIVTPTELPGVLLIEPTVFRDHRGFFEETWNGSRYEAAGIPACFVQDNLSFSGRGVIRGLHYQYPRPQGKLVSVVFGEVFDVAVDIRRGSPTFGKWAGFRLTGENHRQLCIPPGFAHGFCVMSEKAYFMYKCTDYYSPEYEGGIAWNDPDIGIEWPEPHNVISGKDASFPRLRALDPARLPME